MKNQIKFWTSFLLLSSLIFSGNALWDKYQQDKNNPKETKITQSSEADCINSLNDEVKPLLMEVTCDNQKFWVPKHWYLRSSQICSGHVLPILLNAQGFDDPIFRKKVWKLFLMQMGYIYSGIEPSNIGGEQEDMYLRFKAGLEIAGLVGNILEIEGGAIKLIPNNERVNILISRSSAGKFARDMQGLNKYTTYSNSLKNFGNFLQELAKYPSRADQFKSILDLKENEIDHISFESSLQDTKNILAFAYTSELVYKISDLILKRQQSGVVFDDALIQALQEINDPNSTPLSLLMQRYIESKNRNYSIEQSKAGIGFLTPFVATPPTAILLSMGMLFVDFFPGELFLWDEHPYIYPLYYSSFAYTLANKDLGNDCMGLMVKTLAVLLGDVQMHNYFEGGIFRTYYNILSVLDENGNKWKELVMNKGRNDELKFLLQGYMDCGSPCSSNLKGRVVDELNHEPIPDASVSVFNQKDIVFVVQPAWNYILKPDAKILNSSSDNNGYFYFRIVEDGTYLIRTTKAEYCTRVDTIHIINGRCEYDIINIPLSKPSFKMPSDIIGLQKFYSYSSGTSIKIGVELTNELCKDIKMKLPFGTTFRNENYYHQNILLSKEYDLTAFANSTTKYEMVGYCISRYKGGCDGKLTMDKSLSKNEYETLTKLADKMNYNDKKYSDVQNAVWHFSDNWGVFKGSIAEDLVKQTNDQLQIKEKVENKVGLNSAIGALISTVLISLPLFGISKKF